MWRFLVAALKTWEIAFLALNRFVSTLAASEKEGEDQGLCYRFCDVAGGYGR